MENHLSQFSHAISVIKDAILTSRYRTATLANREMLSLYFGIGKFISENSRSHYWGKGAIDNISRSLQQELPGLRGFSPVNIKRMRQFYEEWNEVLSTDNQQDTIRPLATDELQINLLTENRPFITDEFQNTNLDAFLSIGFTHHYEILVKIKTFDERLFYIERCSKEFWSVNKLKYYMDSDLYGNQAKLSSNFNTTITDFDLRKKALHSFKDEYLLDYINIEPFEDEIDERLLENEIVLNIKNFIMSLGKDFSFIGNQHRLIIDEKEYFIDLLFFNRQLQCLVAIDLKKGDFKPEYAGKMNFYLSALDDLVRLPHENRSIGIILCKSKSKNIVEYAFRDMSKPLGVSTYKLYKEIPERYQNIIPDADTLKQLL